MIRRLAPFAVILALAFPVGVNGADVVYVDGTVDLRFPGGEMTEALIGDRVRVGDVVITGGDGLAELVPAAGGLIRISPDTVFTVQEIERGGVKRTVLGTVVGSAGFKFTRFVEKEPLLGTPTTVAGVRGTEVEIFAGSDGATLVVVHSGRVEVEAQKVRVSLTANEGVEVLPGSPPGEKFAVLRGRLDYSSWNGERLARSLTDPESAIERIAKGLESLIAEIESLVPRFDESNGRLVEADKRLKSIEDADARKRFYAETIFPLEIETSYLALNIRYYALSALSYRRFVLGSMYLKIKARALVEGSADLYRDFFDRYARIIARFEEAVTPHLVEADI